MMETQSFHSHSEMFAQCDQPSNVIVHSFDELLGADFAYDDLDISHEFDDEGSSSDTSSESDDVIDIETIDELEGIMNEPDANQTFTSARTIPSKYIKRDHHHRLVLSGSTSKHYTPEGTVTQRAKSADQVLLTPVTTATSHVELSPIICRTRLNSERIVNELVSMDNVDNQQSLLSVPTKTIEPSIDSSALAESVPSSGQDFSILGIDGIEADDLESLFMQFEGVASENVGSEAFPTEVASENKSKRRALTLEDYRRTRGIAATTPPLHSSHQSLQLNPAIKQECTTPNDMIANTDTQEPTDVETIVPDIAEVKEIFVQDLTNIVLDHDYCTTETSKEIKPHAEDNSKMKMKLSVEPSSNPEHRVKTGSFDLILNNGQRLSSSLGTDNHNRDYKAELTTLLNRIPQYLFNMEQKHPPALSSDIDTTDVSSKFRERNTKQLRVPVTRIVSDRLRSVPSSSSLAPTVLDSDDMSSSLPRAYSRTSSRTSSRRSRCRLKRRRKHHKHATHNRGRSSSSSSSSSDFDDSSESGSSSEMSTYSSEDSTGSFSSGDDMSCLSCDHSRSTKSRKHQTANRNKRKRKQICHRRKKTHRISSRSPCSGNRTSRTKTRRSRRRSGRSSQSVSSYSSSYSRSSSIQSRASQYRSRSRSPINPSDRAAHDKRKHELQLSHQKAMEERRVVFVGGIGDRYTRSDLRKRFGGFGDIERVTIHQRENGENYGFVTFYDKADAYAAVEKGNDVYGPKFNLGFGGRRKFCDTEYADLDGCQAVKEEWAASLRANGGDDDFDSLLKQFS